jgi:hypothetical protein
MIHVVKSFISLEDVSIINKYIDTIKFNTKDDHVPLHDNLFEKYNAEFDLHTRGEMPKHILEIFSKYSKGYYEKVQAIEKSEKYHPPMFSKHYIARYRAGSSLGPQFDPDRPQGTYKSYIYWNNSFDGGILNFPTQGESMTPEPGDLVFFIENQDNAYEITKISNGTLFLSEAWMGKVGEAWMPNVDYENTDWDDWEIKGF